MNGTNDVFWMEKIRGTLTRQVAAWARLLGAAMVVMTMAATMFVRDAVAQTTPKPPKDGLYLYVCLPGNIQGDTTLGGDGLLVLNVDDNYSFVERIALPFAREGTQGDCKGIDASVQTGLIYPMLIDRAVAIDLETSTMVWQKLYDGGCCDRGAMSPFGEVLWQAGNGFNAWYVTSALNGELIETIKDWPGNRAHNTIMSPRGDQILLSPDNNILYLYDTRTHDKIREIGPMTGRNRPYAVNGTWTRVYSSNNGVLGFQASDIETGKVLYRVDAPGPTPCVTSQGAHGTCQHGIALTHDETAIWIPSASENALFVYDMTGPQPVVKAKLQDHGPSGWIACSINGKRMYPASGTVYNTRTLEEIARLVDDKGRYVYSEKLMEVRFENGKVVEVGDQWCNGQVGAHKYAVSAKDPVFGRKAHGYSKKNAPVELDP